MRTLQAGPRIRPRVWLPGPPFHVKAGSAGVSYRKSDTNNYWRAYIESLGNTVNLDNVVGGVVTNVASVALVGTNTTPEILVIVQGNRHRVWVDRRLYIDAQDAAMSTNTGAGLYAENTTSFQIDDLYAQGL